MNNNGHISMAIAGEAVYQPEWVTLQAMRSEDIYALNVLQPLLQEGYLPFSNSAMRPVCLAYILNDIVINERKNILEFGPGISTILIGRLIRQTKLNTRVISIEHNGGWANLLRHIIKTEGLGDYIEIVHAPLQPCSFAVNDNEWYDTDVLHNHIAGKIFDMVIIDGPPAYEKAKQEARYPAGPFIYDKLAESVSIFLDDADREGEQLILKKWEEKYGARFTISGGTLAFLITGNAFNPVLF